MTERGHPGFQLYPDDTSHTVLSTDYQVKISQYVEITGAELIKVIVYSGDTVLSTEEYRIADFLNEDRIKQLWSDEWKRPEALRGRP
jgi:ribonuclease BN (tRNA processing enzyme)